MIDLPDANEVHGFLNTTKTYNVKSTMDAVTNYSDQFRNVRNKIKEFAERYQQENENQPVKYKNREEMLKIVLDFYRNLDYSLYEKINSVLNDYMVTKDIHIINEGPSTGKVTQQGDRLHLEINATPDANGLIAIAQELANTYVYTQYLDKEKEEKNKTKEFVSKSAKKFFAHMMIDYLAKNSEITPLQAEQLHIESLREMSDNIISLEQDEIIFTQMYNSNPEAFANNLENYTPENFYDAMQTWKDNPRSMEVVNKRIKDIGEKGETQHYLMGSVLSDLTSLKLREQFYINGNQTISNLLNGIENNLLLSEITGMNNNDLINQSENLVQHVNEQTMENANENEQVLVMERKRIINDQPK